MSDELTSNQARLLRFVKRFEGWTHLGEDATPDVQHLEKLGLVKISEDGSKYCIAQ
jgi:hypothetical protein